MLSFRSERMGHGELFKGDVDPFMEMGSVDRECSGAWRNDGAVLPWALLWELDKRERTLASKLISLDDLSIRRCHGPCTLARETSIARGIPYFSTPR